jgi:predicted enzyme related to lactoylglutathione lyase
MPAGEDVMYSMAFIDGKAVGAIAPQPEAQRNAGVPPIWQSYVSVESADAAASKADELGGTVHAPPFDVLEAGRMAVIQDPQGAFFMVWEPRNHIGAGLVNAPGALSWNELHTTDIESAMQFYGELFGWTYSAMDAGDMPYQVIMRPDGKSNGGITGIMAQEPPSWLVYIGAEDTDAALAKATELGGSGLMPPMDIGQGRIAVVADPQGAAFALYSGHMDD